MKTFRTEHEESDLVKAALEDERRRLAIDEVADRAAFEREVVVAAELHDGCEVEAALEPGLHLVDAAALHLDGMIAVENAKVVVDRLGDEGAIGGPFAQHQTASANTSAAPAAIAAAVLPTRAQLRAMGLRGAGSSHRSSSARLSEAGARWTGEALLEKHRELRVGGVFVAAGGAIGEVRVDRRGLVRGEVSATAIH